MRNTVKLILILCLCVGMLAMVGCKQKPADTTGTAATTVPEETTQETTQETTTEKPVNIVEDPLSNGEGDPLDAIDGTTDSTKPGIEIDIDAGGDDKENIGNAGNGGATDKTGPLSEGTAYNVKIAAKDLYFNGTVTGGAMKTAASGVEVKMEKSGDGVRFYFMNNGTKTYIEIAVNNNKAEITLKTTASGVWTYDSSVGTYTMTVGGKAYYMAASASVTDISAAAVGSGTAVVQFTTVGGTTQGGNTSSGGDDDFVVDFGDLTGGK